MYAAESESSPMPTQEAGRPARVPDLISVLRRSGVPAVTRLLGAASASVTDAARTLGAFHLSGTS